MEIFFLGANDECPPNRYGVKASRLHALVKSGVRTVGGFAVAAQEHVDHLRDNGLQLSSSPEEVRATRLDRRVLDRLTEAARTLEHPLAVRSSALDEDGQTESKAGAYATILNVPLEQLGHAVVEVWASTHARDDSKRLASPMAVIVQPMLQATVYGVVSSAHPLTGRDIALAEIGATPGAVTSGEQPTGTYTIDRDGSVVPTPGFGDPITVAALREAAGVVRLLQDRQGDQYEIEFGSRGEEIWVLQARPIQVLTPTSTTSGPEVPKGNWLLDPVHYPRPITPLYESIFAPITRRASAQVFTEYGVFARSIELRSIGGWPYVRVVPLSDVATPSLPGLLIGLIARAHPKTRRRIQASKNAIASGLPAAHVDQWQQIVAPAAVDFMSRFNQLDLHGQEAHSLLEYLQQVEFHLQAVVVSNYQTDFAHLMPLACFITAMRGKHGWSDAESISFVHRHGSGDELHSVALMKLADVFRADEALCAALRADFASFKALLKANPGAQAAWREHQRRWGSILIGYDLDQPALKEQPDLERRALIAVLDRNVRSPERATQDEPLLDDDDRALQRDASRWYHLREHGESVKAGLLGVVRALALEIGDRLAVSDVLPRREFVFFLTSDELKAACLGGKVDRIAVIARERGRREALTRTPPRELGRQLARNPSLRWLPAESRQVHSAVTLLGQNEILTSVGQDESELHGRAVSSGVHTGVVRIVWTLDDLLDVQPGDVLVSSSANSAWVNGFWIAGALVTETGGLLSHSAIVAREMQIPAVVGVPYATERLSPGDLVTVNGTAGVVTRHLAEGAR